MGGKTPYDPAHPDSRALLNLGYVVVDEQRNAGITKAYLIIAAPLFATVLLQDYKFAVPDDEIEMLDADKAQDIQ